MDAIAPEAKVLVSRKAAAAMLSISIRGVDYMIAAKRLSTRRIANRVLIPSMKFADLHVRTIRSGWQGSSSESELRLEV